MWTWQKGYGDKASRPQHLHLTLHLLSWWLVFFRVLPTQKKQLDWKVFVALSSLPVNSTWLEIRILPNQELFHLQTSRKVKFDFEGVLSGEGCSDASSCEAVSRHLQSWVLPGEVPGMVAAGLWEKGMDRNRGRIQKLEPFDRLIMQN